MGKLRRLFGRDTDESAEDYVRRLNGEDKGRAGYVTAVVPSVVELYDRVAALERQVAILEGRLRRD